MDRISALEGLIKKTGVPVEQRNAAAEDVITHYLTAGEGFPVVLMNGAEQEPSSGGRCLIPGASLRILDDCGHLPFLDQPARLQRGGCGLLDGA